MAKRDLYQEITDQIIAAIEAGAAPWNCPWNRNGGDAAGIPRNLKTGAPYQGINIVLLWGRAQKMGFTSTYWLTFKQAKEMGGSVRKGEKGTRCIFYKTLVRTETNEDTGEDEEQRIPMAKAFVVFNLDQIEGIETPAPVVVEPADEFEPLAAGEALLVRSGATIRESGIRAFYSPSLDSVTLPDRDRFDDARDFYATATHELTHWTGAEHRLARRFGRRFGDQAYAFEELVAELGAAFVTAELGIAGQLHGHASYIANWLTILRNDKRAIFHAAAKAGEAHRYLMDLYNQSEQREAA